MTNSNASTHPLFQHLQASPPSANLLGGLLLELQVLVEVVNPVELGDVLDVPPAHAERGADGEAGGNVADDLAAELADDGGDGGHFLYVRLESREERRADDCQARMRGPRSL